MRWAERPICSANKKGGEIDISVVIKEHSKSLLLFARFVMCIVILKATEL